MWYIEQQAMMTQPWSHQVVHKPSTSLKHCTLSWLLLYEKTENITNQCKYWLRQMLLLWHSRCAKSSLTPPNFFLKVTAMPAPILQSMLMQWARESVLGQENRFPLTYFSLLPILVHQTQLFQARSDNPLTHKRHFALNCAYKIV